MSAKRLLMRSYVRRRAGGVLVKRDNDLVRDILLRVESADGPVELSDLGIDAYAPQEVAYHVELLNEAGYLEAVFAFGDGVTQDAFISRLTWSGHEFLDAVRDDSTWSRTKSTITDAVGSASLEVVKAVATAVALKSLGLGG